jgi:hypothetical protein
MIIAATASRSKSEWSRAIAAVVALSMTAITVILIVALFGRVRGEEFSPTTFSRRAFTFYRLPLMRWQISPVYRKGNTGALELYLAKNNMLGNPIIAPRWDIVQLVAAAGSPDYGSAHSLCAHLDLRDERGNLIWMNWTKDHAQLAQVLWPTVARAAQRQVYFAIPEMMQTAMRASTKTPALSVNALEQRLQRQLDEALLLSGCASTE